MTKQDECGHDNKEDDIKRVGPPGSGSWVCGRCFAVIYGTGRSRDEVFRLLGGHELYVNLRSALAPLIREIVHEELRKAVKPMDHTTADKANPKQRKAPPLLWSTTGAQATGDLKR
jgi:hypothetical protein